MKRHGRRVLTAAALAMVLATSAIRAGQSPMSVPTVITSDAIYLAAERLMVERTFPPRLEARLSPPVDLQIVMAGESDPDPRVRAAFVRALGRFEQAGDVGRLILHFADASPSVRLESANALVQALMNAKPEDAKAVALAYDVLAARLNIEGDPGVRVAIYEAIGGLPLGLSQQQAAAEELFRLAIRSEPNAPEPGALRGLETLIRHYPGREIQDATRKRLRELAVQRTGLRSLEPHIEALEALFALHDTDERTIDTAARYHPCRVTRVETSGEPCGARFRRVAVMMMKGAADRFSSALNLALTDPIYHVRLAALRVMAHAVPETKTCWPLIAALNDVEPHVVLAAIDLMDPQCMESEQIGTRLRSWAIELGSEVYNVQWPPRAHALVALTRFLPEEAMRLNNDVAARHELWQVRATAARVAGLLRDEDLAVKLAKDPEPNVRTEALIALVALGSRERAHAAVAALGSSDYQLVLTGAQVIKKSKLGALASAGLGVEGLPALMAALTRLTADDKEPSREPRVELLARIGEWGSPGDEELRSWLGPFLRDVDPVVASAAADTLGVLTGTRPAPQPTRRALDQPTEAEMYEIRHPPRGMSYTDVQFWMSDGSYIQVNLNMTEAPLTVARFVRRLRQGYYKGLTFHRVVPEFVVQGGSPGANEYMGDNRFWLDEIGLLRHVPGALGLSTRGRHTGDGQFFINILTQPGFNHQHTVFGTACVPIRMTAGTKIVNVTFNVRPAQQPCQSPVR